MAQKINLQKIHPVQLIAFTVIILAAMYAAASILNLIFLGLLVAISLMPLINWQLKHRVPKGLAIFTTLFLFLIVILIIDGIIIGAVYELAEKAPEYRKELYQLKLQVLDMVKNAGIEVPQEMEESKAEVNGFITHVGDFLSEIVSAFSNFIMVLLLIVFVVIDATTLRQKYDHGEIPSGSSLAQLTELVRSIRKYLSIAASTGFFTAAGNLVLLLILGVDYPVLWAFLSFLFSFIPNIGFVLSVIGPALLALMEIGPVSAIIVVVGFILINEFIENVVKPRMMGKDLDLSLTVVFLSLIVWAFILGPMGTILAIPLTLVGKMAWNVYVKEVKS